jgi:porphobilinogen deaminase
VRALAPLDDAATHRAVRAERRTLAELEGGCMIPLAAWAREAGRSWSLMWPSSTSTDESGSRVRRRRPA